MPSIDDVTFQALALVLAVTGMIASGVLWKRRGPASGLRGVAWSLLPIAAALTGTLRLVWEIGDALVSWAARLVFSPAVWLGLVVAAISAVLFVTSAAMRRRGLGTKGRAPKPKSEPTSEPGAQPGELPTRRSEPAGTTGGSVGGKGGSGDDFSDIEDILKKHGIT